MKISNTYLDYSKDIWWKLGRNVFFLTSSVYIVHIGGGSVETRFNSWVNADFTKVKIGTKHD